MKARVQAGAARLWRAAMGTELRRNVVETYGTRLFVVTLTFATAVVIARDLGPAGRGFYAVAIAVGAIGVQLSNLGLHLSNTYHVAKNQALLPALIGNTLAVVCGACVAVACAESPFCPGRRWHLCMAASCCSHWFSSRSVLLIC